MMSVRRVRVAAASRTASRTTTPTLAAASIGCVGIQNLLFWLAGAECDDPADRIVWRYADGYSVSGNYFDAKSAHTTAELRQDLVAGIALHTVQPAAVHRDNGALHVNQIILAQLLAFLSSNKHYATSTHNARTASSTCLASAS